MLSNPTFSVVIPTYNRLDVLPEVLAALEAQRDAPSFEIIVVDDGSTDGTSKALAQHTSKRPFRAVRQANQGPAAARNRGVLEARAPWVAFLGDDTVPEPTWLAAHAAAHARWGHDPYRAVIGYTAWHQRMRLTPFLHYINEFGLQFGYALIQDPSAVPFQFLYTSNLSLARERLLEEPFDLQFPYPAWEDIEASYRLFRRGVKLAYEPAAVTRHDHPTDLARFADRQEKAGYSAVVFFRLHPELGALLGLGSAGPPRLPMKARQRTLEWLVRTLQFLPLKLPRWWEEVLRYHYIRGLQRGWADGAGLANGSR